jgi:hypothetical protein
MNNESTREGEFKFFSLCFKDEKMEKKYLENTFKLRWLVISFGVFTFLVSILNLILLLVLTHKSKDVFNFVFTFVLIGLNFLGLLFNFNAKKYFIYFTSIYFQLFLFSFNIFQFGNQLRILNDLGLFTVYKTEEFILIKDFLIFFTDIFFRFLLILTPFNNFLFFLISNIFTILVYFFIFEFNNFFTKNLTTHFICFSLTLALFSLLSRINMKNNKTIFLYKEMLNLIEQTNKNNEVFINNINSGYIKWRNEKIIEKNNFFQKEKELLSYLIKDDENIIEITDEEEARDCNIENFKKSKKVLINDFNDIEYQKILKLIFSNIKFYNEEIIDQGVILDFSSRSLKNKKFLQRLRTKDFNRSASFKSDPNYITIPDNSIHQLDIEIGQSKFNENKFERQNSIFIRK